MSVTEGEDKPPTYPTIFNSAGVAVITKIDLATAVEFNTVAANHNIHAVRPGMIVLGVPAKSGKGVEELLDFLRSRRAAACVPPPLPFLPMPRLLGSRLTDDRRL